MSNADLTTDALPSPPREEPPAPQPGLHNGGRAPKQAEDAAGDEPGSGPVPNGGSFDKRPQVVNNVIQVLHSPGAWVGNRIHHYHGPAKDHRGDDPEIVIETENMASLKKSTRPVSLNDIDSVKDHIGHNYRCVFRKLGLTVGEIENTEMGFNKNGSEMMRSLLVKWRQSNYKRDATAGKLANALWDSDERSALQIWASQYERLHRNE